MGQTFSSAARNAGRSISVNRIVTITLLLGGMPVFAAETLFAPRVDVGPIPSASSSIIFDANNDGRPDIAVAAGGSVYLLLQNSGPVGTFSNKGAIITTPAGNVVAGIAAGDFNGDGNQDLVVTAVDGAIGTTQASSLFLYMGNGKGTFGPPTTLSTDDGQGAIVVTDLRNDNKLDLLFTIEAAGIQILLGNGNGTFTTGTLPDEAHSIFSLAVGKFTSSGNVDVAAGASFYLGHGDGTAGIQSASNSMLYLPSGGVNTLTTGGNPQYLTAIDVNNDHILDLVGNTEGGAAAVWLGNGDGTFQLPSVLQLPGAQNLGFAGGLGVADFNFDGKPDLAVLVPGSPASLNIFPGTGAGAFEATPLSFPACSNTQATNTNIPNVITVGDLNGDGAPDVIVSCPTGNTVSLFLSLTPSVFLQTSVNPSTPGQNVNITAVVGSPAMGFLYTTGFNVQFFDGTTALGSPISVTNGQAVLAKSTLAQGIHFLKAALLNAATGATVATSGLVTQVVSATACASSQNAGLTISPGGFRRNPATGQYTQTVTLTNKSGAPITGPLSLALTNLAAGVTALNTDGVTSCDAPAGVPFVDTGLCPGGSLAPGGTLSVNLAFSNPSNKAITYSPLALGGYAPR